MTESPVAAASSYDREAEVRVVLEQEDSVLGRVYRYDLEGLTPAQIAEAEGNQGPAFVYNYRLIYKTLLSGDVPQSVWTAQAAARKLRTWLKRTDLSTHLRADLATFESILQSRAEDPGVQAIEVDQAVSKSEEAEKAETPGIYVYTLPHYLLHPVDEVTGKTLLKVGHSAKDAYYRAGTAGRLTSLPEEPILLRIYPVQESAAAEKKFHAWLRDADHTRARGRRVGSEWYVTSTKFLDRVAGSLDLEIHVVNDIESGDEA